MKYIKTFENFGSINDYEFVSEPLKNYNNIGIFDFDNQQVNVYKKDNKYYVYLYVYEVRFTLDSETSSEIFKTEYFFDENDAREYYTEDDEPMHNEGKYETIRITLSKIDSIAEIQEDLDDNDNIIGIDSIFDDPKDTKMLEYGEVDERFISTSYSKGNKTRENITEEAEEYVCDKLKQKYLNKYNDIETFKGFDKQKDFEEIYDMGLGDKLEEKIRTIINIRFADHVANTNNYFKYDSPKSTYFISIVSSMDNQSNLGWRFSFSSQPKYFYQFIIDSNSTIEEFKEWFDETYDEIKNDFENDLEEFYDYYIK